MKIKSIIYFLIITFILIIIYFLSPLQEFFLILIILGILFLILGIILIFLAKKQKRKFFPILIGISAIAPFVCAILHNLFYALAITFENFKLLFEILHTSFFIIGLLIAPITFIIGVIGYFLKNKS